MRNYIYYDEFEWAAVWKFPRTPIELLASINSFLLPKTQSICTRILLKAYDVVDSFVESMTLQKYWY